MRRHEITNALHDGNVVFDESLPVAVYSNYVRNQARQREFDNQIANGQQPMPNPPQPQEQQLIQNAPQLEQQPMPNPPLPQQQQMMQNAGNFALQPIDQLQNRMQRLNMNEQEAELRRINLEIELLQRKRELQLLRAELNDDVNEKKQDSRAIEAMVQRYSGDNPKDPYTIQKWIDDAESVFDLFNCSEKQKFVNACRLLTGTALLHVRNTKVRNYEQLKDELLTEFSRTHTLNDVFQQLKARHLKPTESVQRYVIKMQEIRTVRELKPLIDRYEKRRNRASAPMNKPAAFCNHRCKTEANKHRSRTRSNGTNQML